jgi:hypothetical protein
MKRNTYCETGECLHRQSDHYGPSDEIGCKCYVCDYHLIDDIVLADDAPIEEGVW